MKHRRNSAAIRRDADLRVPILSRLQTDLKHRHAWGGTNGPRRNLSVPVPAFVEKTDDWVGINTVVENLKTGLFDIAYRLQAESGDQVDDAVCHDFFSLMDGFNAQLQAAAQVLVSSDVAKYILGYLFRETFPYLMRSRFVERAFYKPLGHPGDHLIMEMVYRDEPAGDGKLGWLVDRWCLASGAAESVRSSRTFLSHLLKILCDERAKARMPIRIMNIACGSNRELFDFLRACDYSELIDATGIDGDVEALAYTNRVVNTFAHSASIRLFHENIIRWVLGKSRHKFAPQHVIYSFGLTNYLEDSIFAALVKQAYDHLEDGGNLVVGNFGYADYNKVFLDEIVQWKLIHRTENELRDLLATQFGDHVQITAEETGINLFAIAAKTLE